MEHKDDSALRVSSLLAMASAVRKSREADAKEFDVRDLWARFGELATSRRDHSTEPVEPGDLGHSSGPGKHVPGAKPHSSQEKKS